MTSFQGSRSFVSYSLRRLALKLPTALQIGATYNFLKSADPLGRIWALNRQLLEPDLVFQEGPFFVLQASSPCPGRHDWTKRVRTQFFYVEPWAFAEVLQV